MGNRRDVRNATVIATILGPCCAYEPHGIRRSLANNDLDPRVKTAAPEPLHPGVCLRSLTASWRRARTRMLSISTATENAIAK